MKEVISGNSLITLFPIEDTSYPSVLDEDISICQIGTGEHKTRIVIESTAKEIDLRLGYLAKHIRVAIHARSQELMEVR